MNNKEISERLRNSYSLWKVDSLKNSGFFTIFNGFITSNKLANISGNALKLYIYLGTFSNNKTGEVWHSTKRIANYFNKSERTIRTWMLELENINLIKRMQLEYNGQPHIFLLPYQNSSYSDNKEKYIYIFRLKNKYWRNFIDLRGLCDYIVTPIEKNIKNSYVNVKKSVFTITTFQPLKKNDLKNINSYIMNANDFMESFSTKINYITNDKEVMSRVLFERVRNKEPIN